MTHSRRSAATAWPFIVGIVVNLATPAEAQQTPRVTGPTVVVTAQKEPADPQTLPVSVTAVSSATLSAANISWVSDAATYSPNTFYSDLSARRVSNARFRGIGSSPSNPGITTFIDGVPQLNTTSSSLEFVDVGQVEFVRGPQSALFGRNTLGGLVNVTSGRPSATRWTGGVSVPSIGNFDARDFRGTISGPLSDRLSISAALGRSVRDGFTVNDLTGHSIDDRAGTFGKAQVLWTPTDRWEARAIISGERARDGDYALADLEQIRADPFHVSRDFEGRTDRDVMAYTVLTRREGSRLTFSTITGFVNWSAFDATDLDYSPLPLLRRDNDEENAQFTQEVRFASAGNAPVRLSGATTLRWQAGMFLFTQNYEQDAVNIVAPGTPFSVRQHSPRSDLDDVGVGLFGQGTLTVREAFDVIVGARFDHESKDARLDTFFEPAFQPPSRVEASESFSNVSPQFGATYRFAADRMVYASVGRGYKAGGFNPASPPGGEAYAEETTWNVEGGVKTGWAGGRVTLNAAVFHIDWEDLQINLPNLQVPGQFYIANVGGAGSTGVELEAAARPIAGVDLFAATGFNRARFKDGSVSSGGDVSDNAIPTTPDFTTSIGAQLSGDVASRATIYGRADAVFYGAFKYDDLNLAGQEAYSIANFRAGVRSARPAADRGPALFAEIWVRNAFDTRYVPVAFAYGSLAPSGFVGEPGRPRTFGVSGGVAF